MDACDDVVAAELARSLTGLTALGLQSHSINSRVLLAVLGRLADLRCLSVAGGPRFCVTDVELPLLLGLTRLTRLAFDELCCTDAGSRR